MPRITVITDRPIAGFDQNLVREKAARASMHGVALSFATVSDGPDRINLLAADCLVPLGDGALKFVCDKRSIWKWHLSPLDTRPEFKCRRAVASFTPEQIRKEYFLSLYLEMAFKRACSGTGPWPRKAARYILNPTPDDAISILRSVRNSEWLSIDIETGRQQVNTFGVAWSPEDAVAIKCLPQEMNTATHHALWSAIAELCECESPKVMQNGIYERMYLSRYGIHIANFAHDTMVAQKFLWPELDKGLDNVGRIYTSEPYWKDDGRVSSEEGKQKDWGNVRDWSRHFEYNCKDTSNTLIALHAQRRDLAARGMLDLYDNYIAKLFDPTYEMAARGLPLNPATQKRLIAEYEAKAKGLTEQLSKPINPRSPKAKLALLREKGYKLPVNRKSGKESADALSLKKVLQSHPDDRDLRILLDVARIEKALSSYLRVRTLPDNRIRFMLDPHGTETGRMSCGKDPWDGGFNAQTLTGSVKEMIEFSTDSDRVFMEFDLEQAETRFVAYDANEETLLGMIERKEDIHRYVAAEIYMKPMAEIVHEERQLGKKSGHGANYSMGVNTFIDSCLKEMDLVLPRKMATRTLESYHKLFPGIRRWHAAIENEVKATRKLTNPLGRTRYFYGRLDANTFREAYAYRPQSTVPDVANHLMLGLLAKRTEGAFDFWLHLQVHDSVLISCKRSECEAIAKFALDPSQWHPEIVLKAGRLVIPTSAKWGQNLGKQQKWTFN